MDWANIKTEEHPVVLITRHVEPGLVVGEIEVVLMVSRTGHVRHLRNKSLELGRALLNLPLLKLFYLYMSF